MFELFDFLKGTSSPEQARLSLLEEERKKQEEEEREDKEKRKKFEARQEEFLNSLRDRETQLKNITNVKDREKQNYQEFVKSHYGFTPDTKKEKVLAGILEGIGGIAGAIIPGFGLTGYGTGRLQSRNRAREDYEDEYKKLLGVERSEAQQFKNEAKTYQDAINSAMRGEQFNKKLNLQEQIANMQDVTKNKAINAQEKIATAKQETQNFLAYYQAIKLKADAGDKQAKTQYQNIKNSFAESVGMPVENVNDNMMATILSKKMDEEEKQEWLKNMGLIKKTAEKPKDPIMKFIESYSTDPQGNPKIDLIPKRFDRKTGAPLGGGQENTIPPNATGAQKIAGSVRQAPLGATPITPDGKYFPEGTSLAQQREIISKTPLGELKFGQGSSGKKLMEEYNKNRNAWDTLTQRSLMSTQTIFDGIATGKTKEWQSAFLQNPIVKKFRDAFGDTKSAEAIVGQNEVLALMEHLRARYGTRPAHALLEQVGQTLRSDWDNPETFARKSGSISLMIQLAKMEADDPRIAELVDNSFKLTQKNPDTQKSLAQAFEEEIEDALDKSKKQLRNRYPTMEGVFRRLETPLIKKEDKNAKRRALGLAPIQGPVQ